MLVRFRFHDNPLQSFAIDAGMVMTVEPREAGGTEVVLKNAITFIAYEGIEDIMTVVNAARRKEAAS